MAHVRGTQLILTDASISRDLLQAAIRVFESTLEKLVPTDELKLIKSKKATYPQDYNYVCYLWLQFEINIKDSQININELMESFAPRKRGIFSSLNELLAIKVLFDKLFQVNKGDKSITPTYFIPNPDYAFSNQNKIYDALKDPLESSITSAEDDHEEEEEEEEKPRWGSAESLDQEASERERKNHNEKSNLPLKTPSESQVSSAENTQESESSDNGMHRNIEEKLEKEAIAFLEVETKAADEETGTEQEAKRAEEKQKQKQDRELLHKKFKEALNYQEVDGGVQRKIGCFLAKIALGDYSWKDEAGLASIIANLKDNFLEELSTDKSTSPEVPESLPPDSSSKGNDFRVKTEQLKAFEFALSELDLAIKGSENSDDDLKKGLSRCARGMHNELSKLYYKSKTKEMDKDLSKVKELVEATTNCIARPNEENFGKYKTALENAKPTFISKRSWKKVAFFALGFGLVLGGLVGIGISSYLFVQSAGTLTPVSFLGLSVSKDMLVAGIGMMAAGVMAGALTADLAYKKSGFWSKETASFRENANRFALGEAYQKKPPISV